MFWNLRRLLLLSLSFSIFIAGAVLYSKKLMEQRASVTSVEKYWAETGLESSVLQQLFSGEECYISERQFLSCVNAVQAVANRYNLVLNKDGQLQQHISVVNMMSSEKKQLESWSQFFRKQSSSVVTIDFAKIWEELEQNFISDEQHSLMVGHALNGFMSVNKDPHTYLLPVRHFKEVVSKADTRSSNLGFFLGVKDEQFVLRKVIDKSPASLAGLKRGDTLLEINGQSIAGLMQGHVSELLKGEVGETLKIKILRDGQSRKVEVLRQEMVTSNVSIQVIDGEKPTAVIGLNKFAKNSCAHIKSALETVNKANVEGLLLDLRDNPGGYMEEAACITSLFIGPDQKILEVRYLDSENQSEAFFGGEEKLFDKPMAVLVNSASASASEIVAGALRDFRRALIVGERTFGKGSFQEGEIWEVNPKIAIFQTKGFYYLPSGKTPQNSGIVPDVSVDFDSIKILRENEQYMFPLKAPGELSTSRNRQAFANCTSGEKPVGEDLQLTTAKQLLFCVPAVARLAL